MNSTDKRTILLLVLIGMVPVFWLALLIAPALEDGNMIEALPQITERLQDPLRIEPVEGSLRTILLLEAAYLVGMGIYFSSQKNYRRGEEYGSARWGDPHSIGRKFMHRNWQRNKILTMYVGIALSSFLHRRNLNTIVIGGSGAGKTRYYAKPNLMQCNTSYVVLDPKGELLQATGHLLEQEGYVLRVVDLLHMERSHCYNPFVYLRDDNDVQRLVTNLFKATTPKGTQSNDPFWETSAQMLLLALMFYLKYEAPPEEQNFAMVMEMLRAADVDEDGSGGPSALDNLFYDLRKTDPDHIALKYYDAYHSGSAKTLKSIQITLAARLEKFNLDSLAKLTITDELELPRIGERKTALFALIPDNDTSFNFLVSMLYTQLFQQLFENADRRRKKRLPVHVHFLMDEFANVSLPDDFQKILSVMRSREVSVSIILQNLSQLKALFEKDWESITGNCDSLVYLGGNEQSTHKYISELLGKETIDLNTFNRSYGMRGTYSKNTNLQGRELLTPDEVRMLDNRYAITLIRGVRPMKDLKYDLMKHPFIKWTADGGYDEYVHGQTPDARLSIWVERTCPDAAEEEAADPASDADTKETGFVLLSEEDIANEYDKKEKQKNEKHIA